MMTVELVVELVLNLKSRYIQRKMKTHKYENCNMRTHKKVNKFKKDHQPTHAHANKLLGTQCVRAQIKICMCLHELFEN
jgi:hypothetical protein